MTATPTGTPTALLTTHPGLSKERSWSHHLHQCLWKRRRRRKQRQSQNLPNLSRSCIITPSMQFHMTPGMSSMTRSASSTQCLLILLRILRRAVNERCEADGASVKRTPEETLVMSVEVLSHSGHFIRRGLEPGNWMWLGLLRQVFLKLLALRFSLFLTIR